jgi:hypothetical protein
LSVDSATPIRRSHRERTGLVLVLVLVVFGKKAAVSSAREEREFVFVLTIQGLGLRVLGFGSAGCAWPVC